MIHGLVNTGEINRHSLLLNLSAQVNFGLLNEFSANDSLTNSN